MPREQRAERNIGVTDCNEDGAEHFTMSHTVAILLFLLLAEPARLKKLPATKDDSQGRIVEIPKKADQRGGRTSRLTPPSVLTDSAYRYPFVLAPAQLDATSLALAALVENQRELSAATASKQPKDPVYHATPLQPYGALLDHSAASPPLPVSPSKSLLEQPSADTAQYAADYGVAYQPAANIRNGGTVVPKLTEAVIPQPKYSPIVYQKPALTKAYQEDVEHEEDKYHNYAAKYQFGYQVRDQKTGSFFGHAESRDGHVTKGHYHVLLPDGRLQNVQYYADLSGFHAQVSYNGAAKHPPPKPYQESNHNYALA